MLVFPHDKVYDEGKAAGMAVGKLEAKKRLLSSYLERVSLVKKSRNGLTNRLIR